MVCLALELVGPWVVLGFTLGMEAFGEHLLISVPWSFWCSQDLDLSLMLLVFSLILTVASRLLHLYSTDGKTSRLIMKSFSTVSSHLERYTELHGEEKMEEGDRGEQEEQRGIKWGESTLASNHFPMCSPQSGPLREVHGFTQRGEEEGRGQRWPGG